jgi:site-specific DNA-methyltransferase (adenine-specific)
MSYTMHRGDTLAALNTLPERNCPRRHHRRALQIRRTRQLVRICPEDGIVPDPGTGGGLTGVAALREGRHFIGVELSPRIADAAERRLRAELRQGDLVLAGPEA